MAESADARDSKSRGKTPQVIFGKETYENGADRLSALLGAFAAEIAPDAPDLADLIRAWPTLSEAARAAVLATVKATAGQTSKGQ